MSIPKNWLIIGTIFAPMAYGQNPRYVDGPIFADSTLSLMVGFILMIFCWGYYIDWENRFSTWQKDGSKPKANGSDGVTDFLFRLAHFGLWAVFLAMPIVVIISFFIGRSALELLPWLTVGFLLRLFYIAKGV